MSVSTVDLMNVVASQLDECAKRIEDDAEDTGRTLAIASDFNKLTECLDNIILEIRNVECTTLQIYFEDVLEHAVDTNNSDAVLQEVVDFTNNLYNQPKFFVENSKIVKK